MATKINVGVVVIAIGGLVLLSRNNFFGRTTAAAIAEAGDPVQARLDDPFFFGSLGSQTTGLQPLITPEPDEGELFFRFDDASLDFSSEPFEFAPFLFPESQATADLSPGGVDLFPTEESSLAFAEDTARADAQLQADLAEAAAREAAAAAADLPRIRQFYIDDLVGRLGVPASFFGGTVPGESADELFVNYNGIYESYLLQLEGQSGALAESARLAELQADLIAQLREGGIAGTPTGSTEDELRASAQALIDQQVAATVQRLQADLAAQLAEQEAAAALQQQLAAASVVAPTTITVAPTVETLDFAEENFFVGTELATIEPVFSPIESFEQRREESGIEFFGTFAFDPDEF